MTTSGGIGANRLESTPVADLTISQLREAKQAELDRLQDTDLDSYQDFIDYDRGRYVGGGERPYGWVIGAGVLGFAGGFGLFAKTFPDTVLSGAGMAVIGGVAGAAALGWVANRLLVTPGERRDLAQLQGDPALATVLELDREYDARRSAQSGSRKGTIAEHSAYAADRLMGMFDRNGDGTVSAVVPTGREDLHDSEVMVAAAGITDRSRLFREMDGDVNGSITLGELRQWASEQDRDINDLDYLVESRTRTYSSLEEALAEAAAGS